MLIYEGVKTDFMYGMDQDTLPRQIADEVYEKMHRKTPKAEYRAWENSLQYMYKVLNDRDIPHNSGVAIEYNIPQTGFRVDFILSGLNANRNGSAVIIELKQWSKVNLVESHDALVETYVGNAMRRVVHPSYQAWSYTSMIEDYNADVQDRNIKLQPCAYLHNYKKQDNDPIQFTENI